MVVGRNGKRLSEPSCIFLLLRQNRKPVMKMIRPRRSRRRWTTMHTQLPTETANILTGWVYYAVVTLVCWTVDNAEFCLTSRFCYLWLSISYGDRILLVCVYAYMYEWPCVYRRALYRERTNVTLQSNNVTSVIGITLSKDIKLQCWELEFRSTLNLYCKHILST